MNVFANTNFEFRITPHGKFLLRRVEDRKFLGFFETLGEVKAAVTRSDDTAQSRQRFRDLLASFPPTHRREKPCDRQRRQKSESYWRNLERVLQNTWDLSTPICRTCGGEDRQQDGKD